MTCYCTDQGCDSKVEGVFCDNQNLMGNNERPFKICTGPPGMSQVCQYDGHLFTTCHASCQFEDENSFISTSMCKGISGFLFAFVQYDICVLIVNWW